LRLLVDECAAAAPLIGILRKAGHDVALSIDTLGKAAADRDVFAQALQEKRVVLTFDCADFSKLHETNSDHYGILLVYHDGDARDMTYAQISAAIGSVDAQYSGLLAGQLVVLNYYPRS
jgi:predicted nuclease of predicted toxin-antitoxin system